MSSYGNRVVDVFDKDFSFEFNGGRGAEGFSCLGLVGNDVDGGVGKVSGKNGESGFYGSAVGPLAGDGHGDGAGVYVVALKGHVEVFSFAQHLVFELQRDGGFDGASVVHDVLQSLDARVADIDAACDAALLLKVFVGKQHGAELVAKRFGRSVNVRTALRIGREGGMGNSHEQCGCDSECYQRMSFLHGFSSL